MEDSRVTEMYRQPQSSGWRFALLLALLTGIIFNPQGGAMAEEDPIMARILEKREAAPELSGASAWINSEKALTLADLKGKVVLLDFWTFG
jgi:hypothetical protein